jgi:hypothetical protein
MVDNRASTGCYYPKSEALGQIQQEEVEERTRLQRGAPRSAADLRLCSFVRLQAPAKLHLRPEMREVKEVNGWCRTATRAYDLGSTRPNICGL